MTVIDPMQPIATDRVTITPVEVRDGSSYRFRVPTNIVRVSRLALFVSPSPRNSTLFQFLDSAGTLISAALVEYSGLLQPYSVLWPNLEGGDEYVLRWAPFTVLNDSPTRPLSVGVAIDYYEDPNEIVALAEADPSTIGYVRE